MHSGTFVLQFFHLIWLTKALLELTPCRHESHLHTFSTRLGMAMDTQKLHRGATYGANSSIPSTGDVAMELGVQPPAEAPASQWKLAYNVQKVATPILHLFDRRKPPNSSLNLYCMWWKALAGLDKNSPVYDHSLSFDILPRGTRWIIKIRPDLFPRLHHANVELRTAFLDRAVTRCIAEKDSEQTKIRLICLGAGYDLRCIKFLERNQIDQAFELDLPSVVEAKRKILESSRFRRRRPQIQSILPTSYAVDLNDLQSVERILLEILKSEGDTSRWHTIFILEAVLIYLDEHIPSVLLQLLSQVLLQTESAGSLAFADRLENVPGGDENLARQELSARGWDLAEWLPKPGLARHMGRARQLKRS
jgi:hypothetical protein